MKIYTKTGDKGDTGLFNGVRVSKSNLRVELYGTVDELNSIIGLARSFSPPAVIGKMLKELSIMLFNLGSDLATPLSPKPKFTVPRISQENIEYLEKKIDEFDNVLPELKNFILPGGSKTAAFLHNARTVCRRAERLAVKLSYEEDLGEFAVIFLNRMSDLLFTAARMANYESGVEDIEWK
jgi:cob(I)alamin adenosyltransferase